MTAEVYDRRADGRLAPGGPRSIAPSRRRFRLSRRVGIAVLGLLLAGGIAWYGWNWWAVGRFIETTDDAYIGGNVTTLSPHVAGFVSKILVSDNQFVKAGQLLIQLDESDYRANLAHAEAVVQHEVAALANLHAKYDLAERPEGICGGPQGRGGCALQRSPASRRQATAISETAPRR